jgi:hypothetical protein
VNAIDDANIMLHPVDVLDNLAIPVPGMRVITPDTLTKLKTAIEAFTIALGHGNNLWASEQAVAQQLAFHKLTGERIINTYSVTDAAS